MHGKNIPLGTADPEDRDVNTSQITPKIHALMKRISLVSDMNDLIVFDCVSNMIVASLSNFPSGQRN